METGLVDFSLLPLPCARSWGQEQGSKRARMARCGVQRAYAASTGLTDYSKLSLGLLSSACEKTELKLRKQAGTRCAVVLLIPLLMKSQYDQDSSCESPS